MTEIREDLLVKLKRAITHRRIDDGMRCLKENERLLEDLDPSQKNAGHLTGYFALWVDIGYSHPTRLKELLARFSKEKRTTISLNDYLHLRMAEGLLAMNNEASGEALAHFDVVLALSRDLSNQENLAVASFLKGRCLRQAGEYSQALTNAAKGRALALELGYPEMAAVMRVLESWLLFQDGRSESAEEILGEAEQVLRETDDFVTLGNVYSSYGRIARRKGQYEQAIRHFGTAIGEYRKRDSQHPHLARTLANMALVERLISLQLGKKIDAQIQRRRKAATRGRNSKNAAISPHSSREQLHEQAFAHLKEAAAIYRHNKSHHGVGAVYLTYGYLYLDNGDFERAEQSAQVALDLARQKNDHIILSRVSLLLCMVENAKIENEVGDQSDSEAHLRQALVWAQDAIRFAKQTQNRRLLANAFVWEGLTHANPFSPDLDAARKAHDAASLLLKNDQGGQVWTDLQTLKQMLQPKARVDDRLRDWSRGVVGEKSFQEIVEEFTELIIPKIWESEGRKVSRVAKRLSISPKKVRRILETVGAKESALRRR